MHRAAWFISMLGAVFFFCFSGDANAAPLAFITNYGDGTVSVIDTAIDAVVATLGTGAGPAGVAVNPSGTKAYVVNSGSQSISVIDLSTLSVITPLSGTSVGSGAFGVAVSPDSAYFYVTNRNANTLFAYDAAGPSYFAGVEYFASVPLGVTVDSEGVIYVAVHAGPGGTGANGPGYAGRCGVRLRNAVGRPHRMIRAAGLPSSPPRRSTRTTRHDHFGGNGPSTTAEPGPDL